MLEIAVPVKVVGLDLSAVRETCSVSGAKVSKATLLPAAVVRGLAHTAL